MLRDEAEAVLSAEASVSAVWTDDALWTKDARSGSVTRCPVHALAGISAPDLLAIVLGKREPQAMKHMTRVCGYYSHIENWNKSKVGELRDRHIGNYSIG